MPERKIVGTLTVEEFQKLLRSYGIPCSYYKTRQAIISRVFPFAWALGGGNENTEFLILLEKGGKVALPNDFAKKHLKYSHIFE